MLFICVYALFQSLLISDTFHLILKQKTHRLFSRVQSYTMNGFISVFTLCGLPVAFNHPDDPLLHILSSLRASGTAFSNFFLTFQLLSIPSFVPSYPALTLGMPSRLRHLPRISLTFFSHSSLTLYLSLSLFLPLLSSSVPGEFIHSHLSCISP